LVTAAAPSERDHGAGVCSLLKTFDFTGVEVWIYALPCYRLITHEAAVLNRVPPLNQHHSLANLPYVHNGTSGYKRATNQTDVI
jgi:hypothetical protein